MLDHLDLNVASLERSRTFYEALLSRLGYQPFDEGDGWCSWSDPSGAFYLVLVQTGVAYLAKGFHRKRTGVNHLAFSAKDRSSVDELFAWLSTRGIGALYDGPLEMGDRYAVFFEDPDRLKIEYVYRPSSS